MNLSTAVPFEAAVERLDARQPIGSAMRTRQWDMVDPNIRDRAFFSAGVESERVLSSMREKVQDALKLPADQAFVSKPEFIARMRQELGAAPGDSGRLTDFTSQRRLGLIYDMNVKEANEFGRFKAGQAPALLDAFPARELIRVSPREKERAWLARFREAGGTVRGSRMVALKDSPVWMAISRFGRPYPPFDFGSGMGVIDLDRAEAEELGLLSPDQTPDPVPAEYNQRLEAGAASVWGDRLFRANLKSAFGDQVFFEQGKVVWAGEKVLDLFDTAMREGSEARGAFKFGRTSAAAIAKAAPELEAELTGKTLNVRAGHLWHSMDHHGPRGATRPGSGEQRPNQLPMKRSEYANLNSVWMQPDAVRLADEGDSGILFSRKVRGGILEMVLAANPANPDLMEPVSIRKKKLPGKEGR